jgi:hypothetical protein
MSDRAASLIAGGFLPLLSLGIVMGAVSLGTHRSPSAGGYARGSYLVYNFAFETSALLLAMAGAYFFYESGKSVCALQSRSTA